MLRSLMVLIAALTLGLVATAASAATVTATIGAGLQARSAEYGARDVAQLREDLVQTVSQALDRARGGAFHARSVEMILEEATPNRPTIEQMGRNPSLSMRSLALGGARISGKVIGEDGAAHPFSISFYANDLRDDLGASTWSDAYRAFDSVAQGVVTGRLDRR